jgi:hypothetical protein
MPAKEGPYHIRGETEMHDIPPHEQGSTDWGKPILPIGLVREFQVSIEHSCSESVTATDASWHRGRRVAAQLRVWLLVPQVLKVPTDIEYNGRGPLLSARLVDLDMLWARGEQVIRLCKCLLCPCCHGLHAMQGSRSR